jgi:hypothetical protein
MGRYRDCVRGVQPCPHPAIMGLHGTVTALQRLGRLNSVEQLGDVLGDHGLRCFYDCMSRAPHSICGPAVPTNQRCAVLVSTLGLVLLCYNACDANASNTLSPLYREKG